MSIGLIGTKIGMTREFIETGQSIPVTVIKVEKGRVLDVISKDKRGYNAVKIGFFKLKNSKLTKQMKGYFTKKNTEPKKILKEFRVEDTEKYKEGNEKMEFWRIKSVTRCISISSITWINWTKARPWKSF